MPIRITNIGTANGVGSAAISGVTVPSGSLIVACLATDVAGTRSVSDGTNTYSFHSQNGPPAVSVSYAWNTSAISAATLTYSDTGGGNCVMSAFYATGIQTTSDPYDAESTNSNGSSTAPSCNATSTANGDLFVMLVGTLGANTDTFTQSSNFAWNTPPLRVGRGTNITLAGGILILPVAGNLIYAPTLGTSRSWVAHGACFKSNGTADPNNSNQKLITQGIKRASFW